MSLDELARVTCFPLRSLARLESGAFDAAPDGFARGFVRTVALALGLDPDETVGRMLPEARPGERRRTQPLTEPARAGSLVLAVLALAAVLAWWVSWPDPAPVDADSGSQTVPRRNAVLDLAREQGLLSPAETP